MASAVVDDLHPLDDSSFSMFTWAEWFAANGELTTPELAFEFFTWSSFYDKQSNNQVLRMQTMHTGLSYADHIEELKRFTGIEFAVVHAQPPSLFIIHKRERLSRDEVRPIAAYFIICNKIYPAPDAYTLICSRMLGTVEALQCSLDTIRHYRPDYSPRTGFVWPVVGSSEPQSEGASKPPKTRESSVVDTTAVAESTKESDRSIPSTSSNAPKKQDGANFMLFALETAARHTYSQLSQPNVQEDASDYMSETLSQVSGQPLPSAPHGSFSTSGAPITAAPSPSIGDLGQKATSNGASSASGVRKRKKKSTLVSVAT